MPLVLHIHTGSAVRLERTDSNRWQIPYLNRCSRYASVGAIGCDEYYPIQVSDRKVVITVEPGMYTVGIRFLFHPICPGPRYALKRG